MSIEEKLMELAKEWEEMEGSCQCADNARSSCAEDLRLFARSICVHDWKVNRDELGTLHKKCSKCGERKDAA